MILDRTPTNVKTPETYSQVTPVNQIMQRYRQSNMIDSPLPKALTHIDTPETPLGAFIRPNPSPNLRKEMVRFLNTLPDWKPPPERRASTVSTKEINTLYFSSLSYIITAIICSKTKTVGQNMSG